MKRITLAGAAAAALLLSACSTPTQPTLIDPTTLEGQTFRWALGETSTGQTPMVVFGKDGRLSGFAGCNRIMGSWKAEGTGLSFLQVATTRMMCDADAMKTEEKFLGYLRDATGAVATPAGVDFVNAEGKVLVNLEKVN